MPFVGLVQPKRRHLRGQRANAAREGVTAGLFVVVPVGVAPDRTSPQRRSVPATDAARIGPVACPQLALLRVDGSLFFGAVEHVRDELHEARQTGPERRHILLIGSGINFIDVAGAELLVQEARITREAGGALYLCNLKPAVREILERGRFLDLIGRDCVFATKDEAIRAIYARLESSICRSCTAQIFGECESTLPDSSRRES